MYSAGRAEPRSHSDRLAVERVIGLRAEWVSTVSGISSQPDCGLSGAATQRWNAIARSRGAVAAAAGQAGVGVVDEEALGARLQRLLEGQQDEAVLQPGHGVFLPESVG